MVKNSAQTNFIWLESQHIVSKAIENGFSA